MKFDKQTLILLGIILLLAYLLTRSCSRAPSPTADTPQRTAMMQRVADSSRKLQAREDSLVIRRKDRVIDSLVPLANASRQKVHDEAPKVLGQAGAVQEAMERKDTVGLISHCDSLSKEVAVAAQAVAGWAYQVDTLVGALQDQRRIQDSIIRVHTLKEILLMKALDTSDVLYNRVTIDLEKATRRANKRWSIGPGVGATYANGQVQPVVDISVHYDLLRF